MKFFNTAGPVNQPEHYKVDPLHRWDLQEILSFIQQKKYFILHAPRQTGKTSSLLALQDYLNKEGNCQTVYINVEIGQSARNDVFRGINSIIGELKLQSYKIVSHDLKLLDEKMLDCFNNRTPDQALNEYLTFLSDISDKPLILLIDEIDALVGDTLIAVLRQIRAGYSKRPESFPSSVVLCGVRDIKDYRINTSGQDIITGGSAFNIKAKSLRLGNFSKDDVINLYTQHTKETGQIFSEECYDLVMNYTDGQPWLVNALANEVTYEMQENRNPSVVITPELIEKAKERLVLSRQTHLDQLADKLEEDRVRRIVLPIVLGEEPEYSKDDEEYCIDLGLIKRENQALKISNQIYTEVIPRELTRLGQDKFLAIFQPDWVNQDGSINVKTLLSMFKDFWNENTAIWSSNIAGYQEAAPQLVTQAFLQRVANGNGFVNREYGLGRKRTDLMLKWQYNKDNQIINQKIIIELKVINKRQNYEKVIVEALKQTAVYAKTCGVHEANILIFDRDESQNWAADTPNEVIEHDGVTIEIWKLANGNW